MDPIIKLYMFNHWVEDHKENFELLKNHGYLIASFTNPEAVQNILKGNQISSSDEDFEAAFEMVRNSPKPQEASKPKRRRKIKNG